MKTQINITWQITMLMLLVICIAVPACLKQGQGTNTGDITIRDGYEDPYDEIEGVQFEDGKEIRRTKDKLKSEIEYRVPKEPKDEKPKTYDHLGKDKLHPLIGRYLQEKTAGEMVEVLIRFQDSFPIPRFPELNPLENRSSAYNQAVIKRATSLGDELRKKRSRDQAVVLRKLKKFDAKVSETFWIVNSVVATISVGSIKSIAEMSEVLYIDPVNTEDKPPQNANNDDDVQDGRRRINSDPYFNLGQRNGFIGLLDSGVDTDHELFTTPNQVDFMFDCVEGGSNCNDTSDPDFNPNDDCWDHGTSSAAIMTANNDRGNNHRGVTAITVDNLKVYPSGCVGLNTTAAVRGFERAIEIGDRVIVAEMQGGGDHKSSIAEAADNAFEAGAVIIAANGNNGPGASTVNCPANAHKVMGIGNYDVQTQAAVASQSRGPSDDDRFKPDFRCPTNSETADSGGFSSYSGFGGTSGATPYAGAAAALVRNFMRGNTGSIDPGKVYAFLINSAQDPYPFNNDIGAGDLVLPVNGHAWWGKTTITDGANRDITINITDPNYRTLDMAIWWPEENFEWTGIIPRWDHHDDVDLRMINPSGSTVSSSVSIPSVFERVRTTGSIGTGNWKIRIHGFDIAGTQTVYWCVTGTR